MSSNAGVKKMHKVFIQRFVYSVISIEIRGTRLRTSSAKIREHCRCSFDVAAKDVHLDNGIGII